MAKLALKGGEPVRRTPFPKWPIWDERELRGLREVLESGVWGIGGRKQKEFEERFAAYQDAAYGVTVPGGTAALEVALRAAGIGAGDEVIIPAYTFVATASAILAVNALPVFADVEPDTYTLDVASAERLVTPRTKAVIPVHIAGRPTDMDAVMELAARHRLTVIEDACQAWGAQWRGRGVGSIGHLGCFSFQSSKNITCGEGGIVLTND
ncbi:MAG: DegT/DnrJ/EryC1/StrS family aminotransferase, partial [Candidatus Bathyarchaeia archaeon]